MEINLEGISKRFKNEWIFRGIDYHFFTGTSYAITGANGSGKSTLLLMVSGYMLPSEGTIRYSNNRNTIPPEETYKHISFVAPYINLMDDFTLQEQLNFHFKMRGIYDRSILEYVMEKTHLTQHRNKFLRNFSSGMMQRVRLGLGLYSSSPVILLDEPCTNLDDKGRDWFFNEVESIKKEKIILLASNQNYEYSWCQEKINIEDFK
jgi:ABC-type multidrug transport system ATPase subunit